MADAPMDNQTLIRRTLLTAGVMVGACVVFVGLLTLIATVVVGHAVSPEGRIEEAGASKAPSPNAGPAK
jgi:hypothetical protein